MNQVQELEQAILARAERLAGEYRERASRSRDNILREAAERLRMRESREESIAKTLAERTFRQHVQASELKMQTHLDRMRWNLVQDVERALAGRMRTFGDDLQRYDAWLDSLIVRAANLIEEKSLIVSANARDLQRMTERWDAILETLPEHKTVTLSKEPIETLGGVLVASRDRRIRVDNTYEGRLERLRPAVQQVILERLLPSGFDTGNLFSG
ncbi:V-type ATP synthase subunit E [Thiocapsa roseopersicina]|uniref:V-type ATP synthase subunit E n=1 Tax=Thiocapsa roseopersicina TaxID=1058 RepID=A0A1H2SU95_THIRO|nr:V-type ATP synthase subunit E family protein [Thiocapsa roseopersicina]SDW35138.1 V/A-type H+-transporting ATPase subunit E [Thiocapsa roseopersicina]